MNKYQRHYRIILTIIILAIGATRDLLAQVLPVGMPALEERYRREQLLGNLDSTVSFSIRPLSQGLLRRANIYDPDSSLTSDGGIHSFGNHGLMQLMPLVWQNQYTSAYPYGWNDGAMIPARGWQTYFSAGVFAKYKFISVQLRPEFVLAQNKSYMGFDGKTEASWDVWYRWANNIDMPERFGNGTYSKAFWGQSYIRFNFEPVSFGLSTENLWWGPGRRNSLLMSNTAPGFTHLTLNTTRPIHTPIGSFEGQLIAGRLQNSGYPPTPLGNPDHYDKYYVPKRDDWRYISGVILSYQPKWLPGLSLGLTRSFVRYHNDGGNSLNNLLPLLGSGSERFNTENPNRPTNVEMEKMRDQYSSVFGRWAFPKGKAEIYAEYGRTDPPWNSRDLIVQMEHSRAYIIGFTKLVPLKGPKQDLLQLNLEFTQLERSRTAQVRRSPTWYGDDVVQHGYTNNGQILGAGVGPGSNLQSVSIDWIRGMKQIGIQIERLVHNNDFYYDASGDIRKNWVDLGTSVNSVWNYRQFVFTGTLAFMHAYNYQYEIGESSLESDEFWNFERRDKNNVQLRVGVMYRF
ncbi:MAG: capsule assembly Wzi family protein [Pseudosphingobacterium sp.]|nr:capsule assembly Wzi family protein [Olivibacter sp. UJ_SKK_5.1]MDX3912669.1 capsule assembly Wzi family protein [Pseudosphingobacterium sp.]